MTFGPDNFLKMLRAVVTGDGGISRDIDLPAGSAVLSGATEAVASDSEASAALVFDADSESAGFSFVIPRDFDRDSDELTVEMLVQHISGTSIDLQIDGVSRVSDGSGNAEAVAAGNLPDAETINAAFDTGLLTIDLSGLEWQPGERVMFTITSSGLVSAGVAHLFGGRATMRSSVVQFDDNDSR